MWRSVHLLLAAQVLASTLAMYFASLSSCSAATEVVSESSANELHAESARFAVNSFRGGPRAQNVVKRCESICSQLRCNCLGKTEPMVWQPKCQVVLHSTLSSYRRATGQGSAQTVGCTLISTHAGRVTQRRIDLLVQDVDRALAALPHEMTHVLLADVFPKSPPPRWAEEGLALLSDPADKRARHDRDLRRALQTNTTLPLVRFCSDTEYPSAGDRGIFYAQSLSLAEYLVGLDTPQRFVEFVELSQQVGQTAALERIYEIRGLNELENRWLRHAMTQSITSRRGIPVSRRDL